MNIPVRISVGCKILYFKAKVGILEGTVTKIRPDFIKIEDGEWVSIKKIIQFTFGGVWVVNRKYDQKHWPVFRF